MIAVAIGRWSWGAVVRYVLHQILLHLVVLLCVVICPNIGTGAQEQCREQSQDDVDAGGNGATHEKEHH